MASFAESSVAAGLPLILCCMCGTEIHQNPTNMCVACLRENVDITESINTSLTLHSCRSCGRFLCPPWQTMQLESKELMAVCLRKVAGLSKVKVIDAVWIWTEPHSMRLKIKLTIQKEVINGAILQQAVICEFTIRNQQCRSCEQSYAQGSWHACVQVRQRVPHKRTFLWLEQILLKHNAHSECIRIVTFKDGMDFYYTDVNQARRFQDFLEGHLPIQAKYARKLVTADHKANVGNFKHNLLVEIAPICKDDLLILPKPLAANLSNISRLVIARRIGNGILIVDPFTGERNEVDNVKYWRYEFKAAMSSRELIKFVVLSIEPMLQKVRASAKVRGGDRKMRMAECIVAREKDFGVNDTQYTCITHLGNVLREGDVVLGYDLTSTNWNSDETVADLKLTTQSNPDLVLVRKYYGTKGDRKWALRNLNVENDTRMTAKEEEMMRRDQEDFYQEIDADKEYRANINLFKKKAATRANYKVKAAAAAAADARCAAAVGAGEMEEQGSDDEGENRFGELDDEEVGLDELLDDLDLDDGNNGSANDSPSKSKLTAEEIADLAASRRVVSAEEAAATQGIDLGIGEFDTGSHDAKAYKFV